MMKTKKEWRLSPAYDLTYSSSFNGEHATTINGEGRNPSLDDILAVAKNVGIKEKQARDIALDIKNKCLSLNDYKLSERAFVQYSKFLGFEGNLSKLTDTNS